MLEYVGVKDDAKIFYKWKYRMLDEKTRTVALIRKKYPDYTLNELCNAYQDETGLTISKSGLHHRFKKLSEQAAQLMQMQNE